MADTPRKHLCTEETGVRIAEAAEGIVEKLASRPEATAGTSDDNQADGQPDD